MKKNIFLTILLSLIFFQLYADFEDDVIEPEAKRYSNSFYFGPDIFWLFYTIKLEDNLKAKTNGYYLGLRLRYEFLQKNSPYFGVDLMGSWGWNSYKLAYHDLEKEINHDSSGLGVFDLRLGYPFFTEKAIITPFVGLGEYFTYQFHSNHLIHLDLFYFSGGYLFRYEVSPEFSIGQNTKVNRFTNAKARVNTQTVAASDKIDVWGLEVAVPFEWLIEGQWTFKLEPYYLRMDFSKNQDIFGSKFMIGYHF